MNQWNGEKTRFAVDSHHIFSYCVTNSPVTAESFQNRQKSVFISYHWAQFNEIAVDNYKMNKRWRFADTCTSRPFVCGVSRPPLWLFSLAECNSSLLAVPNFSIICLRSYSYLSAFVVANSKSKLYAKFADSQVMNMSGRAVDRWLCWILIDDANARARSSPIDFVLEFGDLVFLNLSTSNFSHTCEWCARRPCHYVWQRSIVCYRLSRYKFINSTTSHDQFRKGTATEIKRKKNHRETYHWIWWPGFPAQMLILRLILWYFSPVVFAMQWPISFPCCMCSMCPMTVRHNAWKQRLQWKWTRISAKLWL